MIPRRVWINLGAFFLLFGLLLNWAVRNIITLDQIDQPYRVTASFESSPGLQANVAVTFLGVQVGTIDRVALDQGAVRVDLDIDRGQVLPEGLSAAVLRKSAVGEPYVSLEAPEGYGGDGPYIDPESEPPYDIPIERTRVPLSYADLFASLDGLLGGVPAAELEIVVHELAVGLGGRGPEIRTIIESTADLTDTLAEETELFDALADDLTQLTNAIASQSDALGTGFDNVTALTATLAASRVDIETLLENAPDFGDQVAELINEVYPNLACTFESTGAILAAAGTDQNVANLVAVLVASAAARDSFNSAIVQPGEGGADGYYLGGSFTLGVGEAPPAYATPATLPAAPALRSCQAGAGPDPGAAADGSTAGGAAGTGEPSEGAAPDVSDRPTPGEESFPASSDLANRDESFPLTEVILAFAAALVLVALFTLRPWRLLGVASRDDDGGETPPPRRHVNPEEDEEIAEPGPRRRGGLLAIVVVLILSALVVSLVALTVTQSRNLDDVEAADADERDPRLVASQFAEAFFTYDYTDVDTSREAVLSLVTEEYAANFEANRLPGLTELFTNTQLSTVGTSQDVFLTEIADSAAQAVVIVDVEASGELKARTLDDLTLILQLRQQDGEWRIDEVKLPQTRILGPDGQPVGETTAPTTVPPG